MITKDRKQEVLTQAWEDWSGLWEAAWGLRSRWPELTEDAAIDEAREVLTALLRDGLIYFCRLDDSQQETRLTSKEAEAVVEHLCWDAPPDVKDQFWFATTDKGDAELRKIWAEASS